MTAPEMKKVRALDVLPYAWGVWCSIAGGKPFVNTIEYRQWSEDGTKIWFGLDSHHILNAAPDEELELVPQTVPHLAPINDHAEFLAKRPTPTKVCEACAGKGKVPA